MEIGEGSISPANGSVRNGQCFGLGARQNGQAALGLGVAEEEEVIFNNGVSRIGELADILEKHEELKFIPQFFRADADFTYRYGGQVMRDFLSLIPGRSGWKYVSVDTRINMLMQSWYPCIPGWHCDDFYRPTGGQPDLSRLKENAWAEHYAAVVGDCSLTEFIKNPIDLPLLTSDNRVPVYGLYNKMIEEMKPETFRVKSGEVFRFSPTDFHRGTPAVKNGWRMFARLTFSNHYEPKNEIRTQTQVYLTDLGVGW